MKANLKYFIVLIFLFSFKGGNNLDSIIMSIESGNPSRLSAFFDLNVEISLPDKSSNYSKGQAELVLKDFFKLHQVKRFQVLHSGENMGAQYCIGNLYTHNGTFRTTLYIKQTAQKSILQEIKFDVK
jgi:hypothetical protein